jgi:hypothetical protein
VPGKRRPTLSEGPPGESRQPRSSRQTQGSGSPEEDPSFGRGGEQTRSAASGVTVAGGARLRVAFPGPTLPTVGPFSAANEHGSYWRCWPGCALAAPWFWGGPAARSSRRDAHAERRGGRGVGERARLGHSSLPKDSLTPSRRTRTACLRHRMARPGWVALPPPDHRAWWRMPLARRGLSRLASRPPAPHRAAAPGPETLLPASRLGSQPRSVARTGPPGVNLPASGDPATASIFATASLLMRSCTRSSVMVISSSRHRRYDLAPCSDGLTADGGGGRERLRPATRLNRAVLRASSWWFSE